MSVFPPDLPEPLAWYHKRGWAIFPVRGKVPLTPNGFKDASKDPQQWLRWLKEFPGCGWAAPTGELNGFDALDADTPEAVADCEARLPPGPRVRTGRGGRHFYVKHEAGARNWAKRIPGCDFRGEGGYVVLPGSIHESGQPYEWIEGTADIPLPNAPEWLREVSQKAAPSPRVGPPYREGERNQRLFEMACAIRAKGHDVLPELRRENARLCDPPLPDDEVVRISESAARYPQRSDPDSVAAGDGLFSGTGNPDRAAFVVAAMSRFSVASLQDSEELLVYREGQYVSGASPLLKGWIEDQFRARGETASSAFVTETIAAVVRRSYVPRKEFDPPGLVCLANGVLNLTDPAQPVLRPHDPKTRFTGKLPVEFHPDAKYPAFDRFITEVLPNEADRVEVRKLFGYCLVPGNRLQMAFLFAGEGANGKSTLLGVLCALLGEDNISAETLQSLVTNRFATAKLWGKRANICADIPANPLPFTGTMKVLTGGDYARGENKFGHPFYFINGAKLIFSANELPEVTDRTHAFWRRWFMVRFTECFSGREDRGLPDRLRAELSGVLNWALVGLADLAEDREFKATQTSEQLALEWRQHADPVYWFVTARLEKATGDWISKEDLYEAHVQFCESHGCSPRKVEVFGKLLPTHAPWVRTERRTVAMKPVRGWLGLRVRPEPEVGEPAHPVQPATPPSNLTGWAGKAGSLTSVPGPEESAHDPEDLFSGRPTRGDRARSSLGTEAEEPAYPAQPDSPPPKGDSEDGSEDLDRDNPEAPP